MVFIWNWQTTRYCDGRKSQAGISGTQPQRIVVLVPPCFEPRQKPDVCLLLSQQLYKPLSRLPSTWLECVQLKRITIPAKEISKIGKLFRVTGLFQACANVPRFFAALSCQPDRFICRTL
jgi:hypothetical protein